MQQSYLTVLLILILTIPLTILGQENREYNLRLGVITETLTHPGLNIGLSTVLRSSEVTNVKRNKSKQITKDLLMIPQVAMYQHPANHAGLMCGISIGRKRQVSGNSLSHFYGIGIGGLTQFNAGVTYSMDENDNIIESTLASRTYLHPHLIYELGYQFSPQISGYSRAQLGVKVPYNTFFSIVPILEIGVAYMMNQTKNNEEE